jgi:UDP-glucose 4-epimerase
MTWLVTGGAGYIGAHVVRDLLAAGERVVVVDDLSSGMTERLTHEVEVVVGTVLNRSLLDSVLRAHNITGVVHLAARKFVDESVRKPLLYYQENVEGLCTLLSAMTTAGVANLVFSSSAAVYGRPDSYYVTEESICQPVNPYGESKLVGEWLIRATARATELNYINLRYFNVAGAGRPELTDNSLDNLVPMVLDRLTAGLSPLIFGADYATTDGTCIRDFVHVDDVASAHAAAVRKLTAGGRVATTLNVGRGEGVSVRSMIRMITDVTGYSARTPIVGPRRPGDSACVVAAAELIKRELAWQPRHDMMSMVKSAWDGWRHTNPAAFDSVSALPQQVHERICDELGWRSSVSRPGA